jgi:hypothetical protein
MFGTAHWERLMNIGNWDGGAGLRILLPIKANAAARERRVNARKLAAMIREAGLDCCLIDPDDDQGE